jgi:hypothetical protein
MSPTTAGPSLVERVRGEYREMPGLCLTLPQASRFLQIDRADCERILEALVAERFLARTPGGAFVAGFPVREIPPAK